MRNQLSVTFQQDMGRLKSYNDGVIAVMHVQIDVKGKNYIEANYDVENDSYYGVYLRVGKRWNADSEYWIFNSFLPILKRFKKRRLTEDDKYQMKRFDIDFITEDNVRDFLQAFKLFLKMTNYEF